MSVEIIAVSHQLKYPDRTNWAQKNATAMWKAGAVGYDGRSLRDLSGNGHVATFGALKGETPTTNDPEYLEYDGEKYLSLPGTSGNYASTPDVNLLDANSAHFEGLQLETSNGPASNSIDSTVWDTGSGGFHAIVDEESYFGNQSWRMASSRNPDGGPIWTAFNTAGYNINFTTGQNYILSVYIKAVGDTVRIDFRNWTWRDSDGVLIHEENEPPNVFIAPEDGWTQVSFGPFAAPAGAVSFDCRIMPRIEFGPGIYVYYDAACLREGTDPTFMSSHRIVGDIDERVSINNYVHSGTGGLIDQWRASNGRRRSMLVVNNASGRLQAYIDFDGMGTDASPVSAENVPDIGGDIDLRWTREVSTGDIRFFWKYSGDSSWIQLGNSVSTPSGPLHHGDIGIWFGSGNNGAATWMSNVDIQWGEIRDGIDGPVVARFEPENFEEPHITAPGGVGEEWTIHRSSSGRKSVLVDRPILLFGVDDYLEIPDHSDLDVNPGESLSVVSVFRHYDGYITENTKAIVAKQWATGPTNPGWHLHITSHDIFYLSDGEGNTGFPNAGQNTNYGYSTTLSGTYDGVTMKTVVDGILAATRNNEYGGAPNDLPVYIGRLGNNNYRADMEFIGAAIYKGKALTDLELKWAATELSVPNIISRPKPLATGGFIYDIEGYMVHLFEEDDEFVAEHDINAEVLLVGGGGGGGGSVSAQATSTGSAGGGAGDFITENIFVSAGENSVVVGVGGSAGTNDRGANGGDSSFLSLLAIGGGGGGHRWMGTGKDGASGGGAGYQSVAGSAIGVNGYRGGQPSSNGFGGGGGGGASSQGEDTGAASNSPGGNGGDGLTSDISGNLIEYCGGGGGAGGSGAQGGVGSFRGGDGGSAGGNGTSAAPNSGSGGGGGSTNTGLAGSGGSGIVIVRYKI